MMTITKLYADIPCGYYHLGIFIIPINSKQGVPCVILCTHIAIYKTNSDASQ